MIFMSEKRASGILLHVTSLPSEYGIGDMGPESYKFIDLLANLRQHYWSILPVTPINTDVDNSPYQTSSAFAGNTLLVSPEKMVEDGFLAKEYLEKIKSQSYNRVDYRAVYRNKRLMFQDAYENFKKTGQKKSDYEVFCSENTKWLDDYALYIALRKNNRNFWYSWVSSLRDREKNSLEKKKQELKEDIEQEKFAQFIFFSQWCSLKDYCKERQVKIVGDIPFYIAHDSADVWVHPELFSLTENKQLKFVGGVPPDYFSSTGQFWGNPVYNWEKIKETGFEWWMDRLAHNLKFYDKVRLDHFRGFVAYWQIPANDMTAKNGKWVRSEPEAFIENTRKTFPNLPFIAEDLGSIDEEVKQAITRLGIPGMRVMLFAFDGTDDNPNILSRHPENAVVYSGTHDTNTVKGWFLDEASETKKQKLFEEIGRKVSTEEVSFEVIKLALSSKANLSIIPIQDALSLGSEARMNSPGRSCPSWEWRVTSQQLAEQVLQKLGYFTASYNRQQ